METTNKITYENRLKRVNFLIHFQLWNRSQLMSWLHTRLKANLSEMHVFLSRILALFEWGDEIKMTNEIKHENRVKGVDNSNVFPIVKPLPVLVVAS